MMSEINTQIVEAAMNIILDAGDARQENLLAIDSLSKFDIQKANAYLATATKKITAAHKTQTNQIQDETRGKKSEYSLLFAHAQDTLMTINSEILLTKSLLNVFNAYEQRISLLEKTIDEMRKSGK
ncbi:PTS lactose transporter subunit IIA [Robertmurraya siralis]|uniref:PTS lactose transporter subunit IIA n=1 Tax=Robertmurraya siralis TaxID=77777 RepID=A0A919WLX4_9BACI|nr:PTS lactose/cellobiose transporter subunit IIA [Robertmurraya siralis]PAE19764.1 PTS lactose/cellobiose transporter subunit IIA [Bacillus sp. 7504-2]GIN64127.1 PTS lactose transporter subunit IIA [Robertmurraya siralis]